MKMLMDTLLSTDRLRVPAQNSRVNPYKTAFRG
jgi:hypothetical protein